jgi:hypothetical protein
MNVDGKTANQDLVDASRIAAPRLDDTAEILFAFAAAFLLISLTSIGVGIIAFVLVKQPDIAALQALFIEEQRYEVRPEPVERAVYLAAILATLPGALISIEFVRRIKRNSLVSAGIATIGASIASVLLLAVFVRSSFMAYLLGDLSGKFDHDIDPLTVLLVAVAAAAAVFAVHRTVFGGSRQRKTHDIPYQRQSNSRSANTTLLVIVLLTVIAVRVRSDTMIYGDLHFEAVFYSMSQVMAGRTLLADLTAQYGLYAELLRPMFLIIGFSVLKFTALMTILQGIACLCLLAVCQRTVHLGWLRFLTVLTLSMFVGSNWLAIYDSPLGHEYYQIWPIRFFFPSVSLFVFLEALRRGLPQRWVALIAMLAGIAIVWNLESGIAVFGALVASTLVRFLFCDPGDRERNARLLVTGAVLPIAVVAGLLLLLFLKSDARMHLLEWIKYQTIFYSTGFGMIPMPLHLHPWMAVLGLYLYGLVGAVSAHVHRKPSTDWDMILYLSVVGLALFTYYQGRSHDVVLTFVIWPAILIAFLLADRTIRAARVGFLPRAMAWSAAPVVMFGMLMSLQCLIGLPKFVGMTYAAAKNIEDGESGALRETIDFIKAKTNGDRTAVILDPGQSIYFAATGLASAIQGPGMAETLLIEDRDRSIDSLLTSPVNHVFIKLGKDGNIPHPYLGLLSAYQVLETNKYGLQYLEPRVLPLNDRKEAVVK